MGIFVLLNTMGQPLHVALGVSLIFLGIGSGIYHGAKTSVGPSLDEIGIYLVGTALAFVGAVVVVPQPWFIYAWVGLAFVLAVFHKPIKVEAVLAVAVLVIAYFILQIAGWLPALGVVALFAVATVLWKLGKDAHERGGRAARVVHDYLHGIWHIITAGALFWAYGLLVLGW